MRRPAIIFVAFVLIGSLAMVRADWPADCDPQGRRFQLIKAYGCSPELLNGGMLEIGTLIFLYALPIALLALFLYHRRRYRAQPPQNPVE